MIKKTFPKQQNKTINISLIGNPNSGKTSLFNAVSSQQERVGNYGGVTIEVKKCKFFYKGYTIYLTDLPGTYSLSIYSHEEFYVLNHLLMSSTDIIINVVSASELERNIYLTTQLIDMNSTMIIALNMYDELKKSNNQFNREQLSKIIGCPIIPTIAREKKGTQSLLDQIIKIYENHLMVRLVSICYGTEIENAIQEISKAINTKNISIPNISNRYLSICLLEHNKLVEKKIKNHCNDTTYIFTIRNTYVNKIKNSFKTDIETILTHARYKFIKEKLLKTTYRQSQISKKTLTHYIDKIVINKFLSYPIFFLLMFCIFQCTFFLGRFPMKWIEFTMKKIINCINLLIQNGFLKDMLIGGVISGIGSVIVFLPNIIILYLFMSLLEDSGYMARAAFIMDKPMHKIGLHGKSFIPLVMGFGCNVPAIMGTRVIESKKTRLITILITPFISCSARLPVYLLLTGTFFPCNEGLILTSLYSIGITFSILTSLLFKRFLIKEEDVPFVMELPPYRLPTQKSIIQYIWNKTAQYIKKMGGLIFLASILVWILGYFPKSTQNQYYEQKISQLCLTNGSENQIFKLKNDQQEEQKKNSIIGHVGRYIEPLVKPLGFDWKISSCLIFGMSAKELIVSTMGVIYNNGNNNDEFSLQKKLKTDLGKNGKPFFSPIKALSLLVFILLYFPCIPTLTAIKNESRSWKWATFSVLYTTSIAWIVCFAIYQIGSLLL